MRWDKGKAVAGFGCLLLTLASSGLQGQEKPSASTVFDRYIEATGGRSAWEAVENRVVEATFESTEGGDRVEMKTYLAQPNLSLTVIDGADSQKVEKGSDGTIVWELHPVFGPIVKEGRLRADFLREIALDKYLNWQKYFESARVLGADKVDGRAAWKVELRPADADPQALYFDQESFLLVRIDLRTESLAGKVAVEVRMSDYRSAGGVLLPFRSLMKAFGKERIVTTRSVLTNVELYPDLFVPPDEVLALIDSRAADE